MEDIIFTPAEVEVSANGLRMIEGMNFSSVGFLAHSLDILRETLAPYEDALTNTITKRVQELRKAGEITTSLSEEEEVRQVRRFYHEVILSFLRGEYDKNINSVKVKYLVPENDLFCVQDMVSCLDGFTYTGRFWLVNAVFAKYTETDENRVLFDYVRVLSTDSELFKKIRSTAVFTTEVESTSCKAVALLILEMLFLQMETK